MAKRISAGSLFVPRAAYPDIEMMGVQWEIKKPIGRSKTTIANAMKRGVKQSKCLIIDLRRTTINDDRAIKDIKIAVRKTLTLRKVWVIKKDSNIIEIL